MKLIRYLKNYLKSGKSNIKSCIIIWTGSLLDIHIEKDPVQIPVAFSKLGFVVHYIISRKCISNNIFNKNIYIYVLKNKNVIIKYLLVLKMLIKVRPKIIFAYESKFILPLDLIFLPFRKLLKIKNVIKLDFDGRLDRLPYPLFVVKVFYLLLIIASDITIIESYQAKESFLSFYNGYFRRILQNKLHVLPNGLNSEYIEKIQQMANYTKKERKILVVSRIAKQKGLYELILALSNVDLKDWDVNIVGPIEDHEYYCKLMELINKLNLNNKIRFLGKVSEEDLIKEYASSQIFVMSSKWEGFSIARLEAMAACLPIITTNTGGSEIVKDCCGIIVPVDDINSLSKAIQELINNDDLRKKFSLNACYKIKEYTWENLISNILKYLF
ncbi:glycosyltransferase family 4 protein [Saccharolobus shibatae]|uniref:Glycosyl transferase family 1 domain-containing protein n=1 Tax=Saccharolobus shibatae TaxID=2286 RepID=A0A8F5GZ21_9CREN|nr:glycosyltransferase family 4 protein [Saccharolobus shibatae]QXJ34888.1 hypothetical protein J5U22_01435 [Saccharolobus shibatae]